MYIMVTATYPNHKRREVRALFDKVGEPTQPFLKRLHVLAKVDLECGTKVYTIYDVEASKAYEGFVAVLQRMSEYLSIEGFNYSADVLVSAEQSVSHQIT